MHAEVQIGDSRVMLADEDVEMGYLAPKQNERPPTSLYPYTQDMDALYGRLIAPS